jgi:hypothetical protein
VGRVSIESPSSRMRRFEDRGGLFTIEYPENWRVIDNDGRSVTIVPEGAMVDDGNGGTAILAGAIISEYDGARGYDDYDRDDRDRRDRDDGRYRRDDRVDLATATDDVIEQIRSGNPHLRASGSPRRETIDGGAASSMTLQGRSPVTGQQERVTVYTRQAKDGRVMYAVFVAPGQSEAQLSRTYDRMIASMRIDDRR